MHAAAKIADLDASFCLTEPISSEDVLDILGKSREEVDLVLAVPTWASRKGMKRRAEVIDEAVSQLASVFLARFPGWIRERGDDVVPLLPSFKTENMRNRRIVQTYFKSIKKYAGVQLIVKSDDCPPAKKQRYESAEADDARAKAIAYIRAMPEFNDKDYDAIVGALRCRVSASTADATVDSLSQKMSQSSIETVSSGGSIWSPAPGRSYTPRAVDVEELRAKARLVKGCVELNISSRGMVAVAAMFGCSTVDDRQLRRLVGVTERLHTLHLHSILREDVPFGLGLDGSKLAMTKFEVVTLLRPGRPDFAMAMLPLSTESIPVVMNAFEELFTSLPEDLQRRFAENCKYLVNDNARVAVGIAREVDRRLNEVVHLPREFMRCSMHTSLHMEQSLETTLSIDAASVYRIAKDRLTTSRTHGYTGSLGHDYQLFCEAEKRLRPREMPTVPLDLTTNVRFGKLTTNLAIVAVNAETVIAFLKKVDKVKEAETIAKAKDDIVREFVACHLLWRHLGLRFWKESAKETTMDSYRQLITDFLSCAESIKVSASPAIFITSVGNAFRDETDTSSGVPGFSALVTSLADSEQSSIELNRLILSKLEVFVNTFEHFEQLPTIDVQGLISLTNVASERAFAVSKDTFKSKYNSNKLSALFCCRINSTMSFFTDNDEILKEAFKGVTSDEKRRSDARRSAHEAAVLKTIDEIQERDAYESKIELLTTIAVAKKSWPLNANQFDAALNVFKNIDQAAKDITRDDGYEIFTRALMSQLPESKKIIASDKLGELNRQRKQQKKTVFNTVHSIFYSI